MVLPIFETKERMGDWEMDLIIGARDHQAILTLVERTTNFVLMQKLKHGKRAKEVAKVVVDLLLPYKSKVYSITTDNGTEFADHLTICKKLNTTVYFADPYSSWQKGLIENSNKLIRQYIPKKTSFNDYSDQDIKEIQQKLNRRPRKKLNFQIPLKLFFNTFT